MFGSYGITYLQRPTYYGGCRTTPMLDQPLSIIACTNRGALFLSYYNINNAYVDNSEVVIRNDGPYNLGKIYGFTKIRP